MKRLMRFALSAACRTSWNALVRPAFRITIVTLLWLVSADSTWAYTSVRVALGSNILVDGQRVIFAQGTGSLTVLNLDTGAVLLRKKPEGDFEYSGKLHRSVHGILMTPYGKMVLLDENTFEPIWQTDHCHGAVLNGEHVVSHDGNHTVTCRHVQSGQVSWKIDMDGGWRLLAANGMVLVATADYSDRRSALRIFDLESGSHILRHEATADVHWHQVYFDGRFIYLVETSAVAQDRFPTRPVCVKKLDLEGNVKAKADYKSPEIVAITWREEAVFIWGDKYFADKRVRLVSAHDRNTLAKSVDEFRDKMECDFEFYQRGQHPPRLLPSGVFANIPAKDADDAFGQLLEMIRANGSWREYAPHLGEYGSISHVAEADGKLLLGSTEGHVECLDIESGRPRWLYVFPVIRQTVSYSSPHGMPPYLTQRAAEYRKGLEKTNIPSGSILLPSDFQPASTTWAKLRSETEYPGRIVIDPDPDDPFRKLGRYVTGLAICASLPIAGGLILLLRRLARRKSPKQALPETPHDKTPASAGLVAWFLVLSIPPAYGLLEYGRVSHSWTIALKVIFAMTVVVAVLGTMRLCYARRWIAGTLFSVILIGWVLLMWNPIRFA